MEELLNFLIEVGKLKKMSRKGWILRGVKNSETIAAHTFRMAIMAWLLGTKKKLNLNKILKISLIHDLCEVYARDTTPYLLAWFQGHRGKLPTRRTGGLTPFFLLISWPSNFNLKILNQSVRFSLEKITKKEIC